MKRYGSVTRVRPDKLEEYRRLHASPWPGVLAMLRKANICNYTIYCRGDLLFSHFEYHGVDYEADCARIAADPETQRWWAVCKPCLVPFPGLAPGECWSEMEEIFHME